MASNVGGSASILALNNDGTIEKRWSTNFRPRGSSRFYRYDHQSNTLVYLTNEFISTPDGYRASIRLILLDSNLLEKSNLVLDSTVTGLATQFDYNMNFKGMVLLDSSIIWMSYSDLRIKGKKQYILHISKEGKLISHSFISDTNQAVSYYPLWQLPTKELLFGNNIYNPKSNNHTTGNFTRSILISDTAFNFATKPVIDTIDFYYGANVLIPTRDSGICLGYYNYIDGLKMEAAVIVKYDKNFKKQWTALVPGITSSIILLIVQSHSGDYYVATCGYDTVETRKHPNYSKRCFQDIALSRIDSVGRVLFTAFYGSELCTETPFSMIQDIDGGFIVSGEYNVTESNSQCEVLCNELPQDWLFKVDSLGQPAKRIAVTGVQEKSMIGKEVQLYPNPASNVLTIDFGQMNEFSFIEILDVNGRIVQSSCIENKEQRKINIDISLLSSGSFYCRLKSSSNSITRPFIIQR